MKFLLNANISPLLIPLLEKEHHSVRSVLHLGKHAATDFEIVDFARANDETIITHDLDYGTILAFSGEAKPSVIIFRVLPIGIEIFYTMLQLNWKKIEQPLTDGAIVIFENDALRIRKLPIIK